jgi:hypothetical protein
MMKRTKKTSWKGQCDTRRVAPHFQWVRAELLPLPLGLPQCRFTTLLTRRKKLNIPEGPASSAANARAFRIVSGRLHSRAVPREDRKSSTPCKPALTDQERASGPPPSRCLRLWKACPPCREVGAGALSGAELRTMGRLFTSHLTIRGKTSF